MSISTPDLAEAIRENLSEMRHGIRTISSRFRLKCDSCGNLVDRGLAVGDPCPFYVARGVRCKGSLILNPKYQFDEHLL